MPNIMSTRFQYDGLHTVSNVRLHLYPEHNGEVLIVYASRALKMVPTDLKSVNSTSRYVLLALLLVFIDLRHPGS